MILMVLDNRTPGIIMAAVVAIDRTRMTKTTMVLMLLEVDNRTPGIIIITWAAMDNLVATTTAMIEIKRTTVQITTEITIEEKAKESGTMMIIGAMTLKIMATGME